MALSLGSTWRPRWYTDLSRDMASLAVRLYEIGEFVPTVSAYPGLVDSMGAAVSVPTETSFDGMDLFGQDFADNLEAIQDAIQVCINSGTFLQSASLTADPVDQTYITGLWTAAGGDLEVGGWHANPEVTDERNWERCRIALNAIQYVYDENTSWVNPTVLSVVDSDVYKGNDITSGAAWTAALASSPVDEPQGWVGYEVDFVSGVYQARIQDATVCGFYGVGNMYHDAFVEGNVTLKYLNDAGHNLPIDLNGSTHTFTSNNETHAFYADSHPFTISIDESYPASAPASPECLVSVGNTLVGGSANIECLLEAVWDMTLSHFSF